VNDEILAHHIIAYNQEASDRVGVRELADCRWIVDHSHLSPGGVEQSQQLEQGAHRVRESRLAILTSTDEIYEMASIFAGFASYRRNMNHSAEVEVFTSFEEAIRWLNLEESIDEIEKFIHTKT